MKYILTKEAIEVPENVTVKVKSRRVEVKGPRGSLVKEFKYVPVDIFTGQSAKNKKLRAVNV